jgi:hypothetical protein
MLFPEFKVNRVVSCGFHSVLRSGWENILRSEKSSFLGGQFKLRGRVLAIVMQHAPR